MGFGGQEPDGDVMSFSILTTEPNALMATIHNRMPVIIQPADYAAWLDPELTDVTRIQTMTKPYPERLIETYRISHKVNNPLHDSADLIEEENT